MLRPLPAAGYTYALCDNLGCKGDRLYVIIPHCLLQLFKSALRTAMTQANSITNEYQITVSSPIWQRVEQIAGQFNLSVYELLEQIVAGKLKVVAVPTNSEKLSYRDIANAFLWLASQTNVAINVYKLQKLMYYAQAWYLGVYGKPLFDADFQAGMHGPVIPDLLEKYQLQFSCEPIIENIEQPKIPQKVGQFLEEVAEAYFEYDDETLERMICSEKPWLEARGDLPRDESCHGIISHESMKKYHSGRVFSK
ncbi:type II toxin-antitoxin system antitoxin SocA domain-containing protein [Microcoleus sp. K5-D4]|uniref:type II toxin-antitoxin system antitoxin SocA domain-containing protein n=1 Tax=Microcoleus sp. K5-D4 TaxID=2818801 RepID=UPI002FD0BA49